MHQRFKPGSFTGDDFAHVAPLDCASLSGAIGDEKCEAVLIAVCTANRRGEYLSIWDLPRHTHLPLHQAFAAVRTLEFGRFVRIADNSGDPLGGRLELLPCGIERLKELRQR